MYKIKSNTVSMNNKYISHHTYSNLFGALCTINVYAAFQGTSFYMWLSKIPQKTLVIVFHVFIEQTYWSDVVEKVSEILGVTRLCH